MSMLYNKTATRYGYTRNATTGISTYGSTGTSFKCNIQPLEPTQGFDDATVYKMKKLYCDYSGIVVGDKISVDDVIYIVKSFQKRDGSKRLFYKAIIQESEGN